MKLYGHPFSNHTRRVTAFCEEARIPYDFQLVDLAKGEHRKPEYLALNPNGKVPTIVEDDGFTLWDSHAILRYLALKHRVTAWYPEDLKTRARIDAWLDFNHTRLGPETGKIAFNTLFLGAKGDQAKIAEGKKGLESVLPVLNDALGKSAYVCGNQPSLADLSLGAMLRMPDNIS